MREKPIIVQIDFGDSGETGTIWFVLHHESNNALGPGTIYYPYKATSKEDN